MKTYGLDAGEMMAPPRSARQPLHEAGRYCGGTCVPSAAEPQRQVLTALPGPLGGLPVLSSGISVRSMVSMRRSLNPRRDTLITGPGSLVEIESTYLDALLVISQPQLPSVGGSPPPW